MTPPFRKRAREYFVALDVTATTSSLTVSDLRPLIEHLSLPRVTVDGSVTSPPAASDRQWLSDVIPCREC